MSENTSSIIIIKRRPLRPLVHAEEENSANVNDANDYHGINDYHDATGKSALYPAESAHDAHSAEEYEEEGAEDVEVHDDASVEEEEQEEAYPREEVPEMYAEEGEPVQQADSEQAQEGEEEAAEHPAEEVPADSATSTPREAEKATAAENETLRQPNVSSQHKKSKKVKKVAKAKEVAPAPAPKPAPSKKKPARLVSINNVERQEPVAEGVNTPRSVALCQEHGVNTTELAPYKKEHFKVPGVEDDVAELRYKSYEERRHARMAVLLPAYREQVKKEKTAEAATPVIRPQEEEAEVMENGQRPTAPPTTEEEAMQRQFELQHQRLLEQERRKTSGGAYDANGHRRSSVRASYAGGLSPRSGAGSTSPGRYSTLTGRPSVDEPYSALKIYSSGISEARPLTESENVVLDEIHEREAHRLGTQERACIIQENKQMMHVDRELEKERNATLNVQSRAEARERQQIENAKESRMRQHEAALRREQREAERRARIEDSIAGKDARSGTTDRYSMWLARRNPNGPLTGRRESGNYLEAPTAQDETTMA